MEFGFLVKKMISYILEPMSMILFLMAVSVYFLFKKNNLKVKTFFLSGLVLLLLFSYPPFANSLAQNLEDKYPKYEQKEPIKYIHVLGNGHNTDPTQPVSSHLSDGATKRVLEGIIIQRQNSGSKIIFTGYKGDTNTSTAQMNATLAMALGVKKEDIIVNPNPVDTREEAISTKALIEDEAFVLVTSATHIPRAMMIFESMGLHPIPAPTNYYKDEYRGLLRAPNVGSLYISTVSMHEYFGMVLAKVKNIFSK